MAERPYQHAHHRQPSRATHHHHHASSRDRLTISSPSLAMTAAVDRDSPSSHRLHDPPSRSRMQEDSPARLSAARATAASFRPTRVPPHAHHHHHQHLVASQLSPSPSSQQQQHQLFHHHQQQQQVHQQQQQSAATAAAAAAVAAADADDLLPLCTHDREDCTCLAATEPAHAKLSRSERKRLWRKNLSAEKLAKLRERDALRKRVERMNMSAEKRRDLRTKDTARKAALRREKRMSELGIDNNRREGTPLVPAEHREAFERRVSFGDAEKERRRRAEFKKISVQSLLN